MPSKLRLGVAQCQTLSTTADTLAALESITKTAANRQIDLVLFPEAYLGGYPRTATFGAAVGSRDPQGREQYLHYFNDAVDLGDTPEGAGKKWVDKDLELPSSGIRGDGIREELERIAKETNVFVVTGLIERAGGTLYCAVVYVCPRLGVIGKRRKVMPTGTERLIWGQGQPSSLRAVTTIIRGVKLTLAAAICWENYMPLLRHSLYSQNVNLYLAPTADARDTWLPLMRTIAGEGRCMVLSANQCVSRKNIPTWISGQKASTAPATDSAEQKHIAHGRRRSIQIEDGNEIILPALDGKEEKTLESNTCCSRLAKVHSRRRSVATDDGNEIILPAIPDGEELQKPVQNGREESEKQKSSNAKDFICRGGSSIVSASADVLVGPIWDAEEVLEAVDVDFDDCIRGRLDLDVAGSYSRNDAFKLTVKDLDISPPP